MIGRRLIAALAFSLCIGHAGADGLAIGLAELTQRLPLLFGQQVEVAGELVAMDDIAGLGGGGGPGIMVDLRKLPDELREALNASCSNDRPCPARVSGVIVHIRGPMISELGVEGTAIAYEPEADQGG